MDTIPPKAFLSHSSADKGIAEKLAMDLRKNGVEAWYDKWELRPGDSLRRKIEQGIEDASFFMVLLTPNSLKSEWVQTELDAGMVKRIEGSCKLLPIVLDLSVDAIPIMLRALKCVKLEPYDDGLRELLNVCLNVETKPPVGSRPAWASPRLPPDLGLSVHAQRLAVLLAERSRTADLLDPQLDAATVLQDLEITEDEASAAADELQELGWVRLQISVNMGRSGFLRISPEPLLFINVDKFVKGWDPAMDASGLAAILVNSAQESLTMQEADKRLNWGPRRINSAAHFLVFNEFAKAHVFQSGDSPYAYYYLQITPRTKRFLQANR